MRALLAAAVILGVLSMFSVWSSRQLLDTDQWTKTSTELLEKRAIRDQVSLFLVDQLYKDVDVAGELEQRLPSDLAPLAPVAASGLRDLAGRAADAALANARVQGIWEDANREAHKNFVKIVEGGGPNVSTTGGVVTLRLRPILTEVANRVGIPQKLIDQIPEQAANIEILRADQLGQAQDGAKLLKALAWVLGPIALLTLILAVYLAAGHRRETLAMTGYAAVAAGLIVLITRGLIGNQVTDSLAQQASIRPAADAAWETTTGLLRTLGWQTILIGLVLIFAAWLGGPSGAATGLRRALAPGLRERPEVAYGVAVAFVLLLVIWSPLPGLRRPFFILLLFVLAPLGVGALRRETESEFPGATGGGGMLGALTSASAAIRRAAGAASAAIKNDQPPTPVDASTSETPEPDAPEPERTQPEQ